MSYGSLLVYITHGTKYEEVKVNNPIDSNWIESKEVQIFEVYNKGQPIYVVNVYSRGHDSTHLII